MKYNLMDRYVYDVTRRLPEASREEVAKELRANINDMLPPDPKEDDVVKVLKELGHPRNLANEYRGTKRYLIAPEWMDDYLRVLKVVLIVFCTIALVFGLIETLESPEETEPFMVVLEVFGKTISSVIDSAFRAFGIVTLVFAAINLCKNKGKTTDGWNPKEELPQIPESHVVKIRRSGTIAELIIASVFGVIWIWFLYHHTQYLGWWEDGEMLATLFTDSLVMVMIPLYVISLLLGLATGIVKLVYGQWNALVAGVHTVEQVFSIVVMFTFIQQPEIFTTAFSQLAADQIGIPPAEFVSNLVDGLSGFFIFLSVMIAIDLISTWVKAIRGKKAPTK